MKKHWQLTALLVGLSATPAFAHDSGLPHSHLETAVAVVLLAMVIGAAATIWVRARRKNGSATER